MISLDLVKYSLVFKRYLGFIIRQVLNIMCAFGSTLRSQNARFEAENLKIAFGKVLKKKVRYFQKKKKKCVKGKAAF